MSPWPRGLPLDLLSTRRRRPGIPSVCRILEVAPPRCAQHRARNAHRYYPRVLGDWGRALESFSDASGLLVCLLLRALVRLFVRAFVRAFPATVPLPCCVENMGHSIEGCAPLSAVLG